MKKVMENAKMKLAIAKAVASNRLACRNLDASLADDNAGMGTIEIVLIIVVLIGLVLVFKENINGVLETVFGTIDSGVSQAATY
ncbi:Putative Flagellin, Flp1-like, domain [Butyrivibrio fibrisolvens DSM 3071]|jgi:urea transporter|uniref:Putative Flagellin, Flp1-like, domain n=1 Tax=Butyrivibrio fibrisolvens DSM 3071 TaxID=1121131 RepID=A0A1M5ZNY0_BUTFI|nr:Flp1 family type IVb pilin [Butyrivibrio fibrisolvens]SHI25912.1 Putative Flagellin, Flp1-like, domain [Butyrivibrio fibrisolvens DSM 3071]